MMVVGEHSTRHISVVGEYVHLGGVLHHSGDHRKEMRRRVAMAHQTFNAHRRHIFQNVAFATRQKSPIVPVFSAESTPLWQRVLVSQRCPVQRVLAHLHYQALQKIVEVVP